MSWCPKCKTEYQDGIKTCADCGAELVDAIENYHDESNTYEVASLKEEALAKRLMKYLQYSGIQSTDICVDSESELYRIVVNLADKRAALKHYKAFLAVEEELASQYQVSSSSLDDFDEPEPYDTTKDSNQLEDIPESELLDSSDFEEEASDLLDTKEHKTYVPKETAYKENRSSAFMFYFFSIAGLCFIGLNIAGVIPFIQNIFSYIVMSGLFIGFFILGIDSHRKSKKLAAGIAAEKELTDKINQYLEQLNLDAIDEESWAGLSDEVLYFNRSSKLKEMIVQEFGQQEEAYLDYVLEEFLNNI